MLLVVQLMFKGDLIFFIFGRRYALVKFDVLSSFGA